MKRIVLMSLLLPFAAASFAESSLRATVNGMVCPFCAQGIEKRISKMEATKAVFVDLKNKTVAVEPKDGARLDEKAIAAEIKDAGYDVVKMETVPQTVAQIRGSMKARK
jgi:copper chaperone CopZ